MRIGGFMAVFQVFTFGAPPSNVEWFRTCGRSRCGYSIIMLNNQQFPL